MPDDLNLSAPLLAYLTLYIWYNCYVLHLHFCCACQEPFRLLAVFQGVLYNVACWESTAAIHFKICMAKLYIDSTKGAAGAAYTADSNSDNGFACFDTATLFPVSIIATSWWSICSTEFTCCSYICGCSTLCCQAANAGTDVADWVAKLCRLKRAGSMYS